MRLMPGMSGAAGVYDSIYCIYEIFMRPTFSRSSAPKHVKLRDTWQKNILRFVSLQYRKYPISIQDATYNCYGNSTTTSGGLTQNY